MPVCFFVYLQAEISLDSLEGLESLENLEPLDNLPPKIYHSSQISSQ